MIDSPEDRKSGSPGVRKTGSRLVRKSVLRRTSGLPDSRTSNFGLPLHSLSIILPYRLIHNLLKLVYTGIVCGVGA